MNYDHDRELERYLNYLMTADERKAFENKMDSDPELQKRFMAFYLLTKAESKKREDELQHSLNTLGGPAFAGMMRDIGKPKPRMISKKILYILAACAVAVIAVFLIQRNQSSRLPVTQQIYSQYFAQKPTIEYIRSGSGLSSEDMLLNRQITQYFESDKYLEAVETYHQSARDSIKLHPATWVRLSYCLLATDNAQESISILTQHDFSNTHYSEDAAWLLLGAYLKTNDMEMAADQSLLITRDNGFYAKQANDIYNQLKMK